jgi:RNA polymerase sigma-70 factor (ECF subfamily)
MLRPPPAVDRRFQGAHPISPGVDQLIPWSSERYVAGSTATEAKLNPPKEHVEHSFDRVYRASFADVARWVRALGAKDSDVEDLTQEVFIIVRRKLPSFDGLNLQGFLYRIAQRTVRDYRRSAWFRNLLGKRSSLPELTSPNPNGLQKLEHTERRRALESILARMSEKRRTTFVLFEIEGYSGQEIAQIQSLPLKTVWTRLYHARKAFVEMVSELAPLKEGLKEGLEGEE